jgi:hypothetical protein
MRGRGVVAEVLRCEDVGEGCVSCR